MSSMFIRISNKAWIVQKYQKEKQNDVNVAKFNSEDKHKYKIDQNAKREAHILHFLELGTEARQRPHLYFFITRFRTLFIVACFVT